MYMRGFRELEGRQWSFIHMDMSAVPEAWREATSQALG